MGLEIVENMQYREQYCIGDVYVQVLDCGMWTNMNRDKEHLPP